MNICMDIYEYTSIYILYASAYMESSCFCVVHIMRCEDDRIAGFLDFGPEVADQSGDKNLHPSFLCTFDASKCCENGLCARDPL